MESVRSTPPSRRFASALAQFAAQEAGNISIMFAAGLLCLLLLGVGVLQYSSAFSARSKLNAIADGAALSAVSSSAQSQYQSTSSTASLQSYAQSYFNTEAARIAGITINSLSVNVTASAGTLTATVGYSATIRSIVPYLLGSTFTSLTGSSTASASLPAYSDFYLLLDDSPSMGIGATPSDISAMQAANNGCAFACHSPNALNPSIYPGYTLPAVPGTQLRIDALRNASGQLISTAISTETISNQFRVGIYTFANTVTTVSDLTSNLAQAQTLNSSIALPTTDIGTQIGDAVHWLDVNKVPNTAGNGTRSAPYQYVFLVTDGVEDHAFNYTPGSFDTLQNPTGNWNGVAYGSVMDANACTSLKNHGVTLAVLYTNYDPLSDVRYVDMVQPFVDNIATALQSCASPGFFFQADHASDISNAMQAMFAQALQKSARLTN
jgi:Flp pilus assembly protein TadG